ncbi:MAG: WG repeat-containing protein, partial [Chitinophagaceae bacterium]|nr:WG repeat-containing protein [Chitinophagaceae bacterium]
MKFLFVLLFLPITLIAQINPKFKVTSKIFYEKIEYSGSGLFGFIQDGNVGYIDKNKNVIIPSTLGLKPGAYNSIPKFNEDYAVFKKDSKYGVVYRTGKEIIPFEYKSLNVYTDPALFVVASKEVNNKDLYGVMNMQK